MGLAYLKALADETRLRLTCILLRRELSVNELAHILCMGQSRISRHLKILAEAGLLNSRRDGLWVFYSVPKSGPGRGFIDATMPFVLESGTHAEDEARADHAVQERAAKARRFFNSIAEDWDELKREVLGELDLAAIVAENLPHDCARAVDLGCGAGTVLDRLLSGGREVIGVDISPRMLDLCRRRFQPARNATENGALSLRIGELSHLPLADQEADFACLNLVLHHLPDPGASLHEARRILKPGGTFFLAEFLKHDDENMRKRYGDHWLGFSESELRAWLGGAGFRVRASSTHPLDSDAACPHELICLNCEAV